MRNARCFHRYPGLAVFSDERRFLYLLPALSTCSPARLHQKLRMWSARPYIPREEWWKFWCFLWLSFALSDDGPGARSAAVLGIFWFHASHAAIFAGYRPLDLLDYVESVSTMCFVGSSFSLMPSKQARCSHPTMALHGQTEERSNRCTDHVGFGRVI